MNQTENEVGTTDLMMINGVCYEYYQFEHLLNTLPPRYRKMLEKQGWKVTHQATWVWKLQNGIFYPYDKVWVKANYKIVELGGQND